MEWISVNDRLPEYSQDVLVNWVYDPQREDGETFNILAITYLECIVTDAKGSIPEFNNISIDNKVTHWMPLPEPPKTN